MKRCLNVLFVLLIIFCAISAAEEVPVWSSQRIQCDADYLFRVAGCNGMLYAQHESGLYCVNSAGEKTLVASSPDLPAGISALLSDDGCIYATAQDQDQAALIRLTDQDGTFVNQPVITLDSELWESVSHCVLRNGFLYYSTQEDPKSEEYVTRLSVTDGSQRTVRIAGLSNFDVMKDGRIMALTVLSDNQGKKVSLQIIDSETGKAEEWTRIDKDGYSPHFLYNEDSDTVCFYGLDEIYTVSEGGQPEASGIPIDNYVSSACLLPDSIALASGTMLDICPFDNDPASRHTVLTICGPYAENEFFSSFYAAHPMTRIRSVDPVAGEPEGQFIQDMLVQNPETDIYILHDLNLLSTIKHKEYYADLSVSDMIKEKLSRMYPPFRQAFADGDKIAAFPHPWYVFFNSIGYNRELFDELGFSIPTTWSEYFDFCIDWKENYEDDFPDISLSPFEHDVSFVSLLACYDDEMTRAGIPADYRSDDLKTVMEKYLKVKQLYEYPDYSGTPLFYEYDLHVLSGKSSEFGLLPLTFLKDSEPIYTPLEEDVCYFVVNPFSTHYEEAVECVALAKDPSRMNDPSIYTEIPDLPLEKEHYDEQIQLYKDTLEMLENNKNKAGEDPRQIQEINSQIEQTAKEMHDYEAAGRWWFTEEDMIPYRELINHVYFSDFNPIRKLYADDPEFFDDVTEETLSEFFAVLNNKIQMIKLEQGIQ